MAGWPVYASSVGALAATAALGFVVARRSLGRRYAAAVAAEFARQPPRDTEPLTEADLAHLPPAVRRYIAGTGAIGQPKLQNMRIRFDAWMYRKPGSAPMRATSEQVNFFADPARHFFMKASMSGIPARVLHSYSTQQATMRVRAAGLFDIVDLSGPELSAGETVTLLNDMCVFAPAALVDGRLAWTEIGPSKVEVRLRNGPHAVSAILDFNDQGELVDFASDDRGELQDDGSFRKLRWTTPIGEYLTIRGHRLAICGEALYHHPEGPFAYGKFRLRDLEYNVPGAAAQRKN